MSSLKFNVCTGDHVEVNRWKNSTTLSPDLAGLGVAEGLGELPVDE